ncbi:MAG: hypothetical protein ACK5O2_13760 [Microthrixaceae bacterium]
MVAFITSVLLMVAMLLPVFWYAKRRHVGDPFTWGEAVVAGTYVFALLFWAYGVVPHHWLTWADSELNWRPDLIWLGPNGSMTLPVLGWTIETPWFPMTISAQAFRDVIATLIYVVLLGVQIYFWAWWQNRDKRAAAADAIEPTTPYGRPLIKRA